MANANSRIRLSVVDVVDVPPREECALCLATLCATLPACLSVGAEA